MMFQLPPWAQPGAPGVTREPLPPMPAPAPPVATAGAPRVAKDPNPQPGTVSDASGPGVRTSSRARSGWGQMSWAERLNVIGAGIKDLNPDGPQNNLAGVQAERKAKADAATEQARRAALADTLQMGAQERAILMQDPSAWAAARAKAFEPYTMGHGDTRVTPGQAGAAPTMTAAPVTPYDQLDQKNDAQAAAATLAMAGASLEETRTSNRNRDRQADRSADQRDEGLGYEGQRTQFATNPAPTPYSQMGAIYAKVANGEPLNPGEERLLRIEEMAKGDPDVARLLGAIDPPAGTPAAGTPAAGTPAAGTPAAGTPRRLPPATTPAAQPAAQPAARPAARPAAAAPARPATPAAPARPATTAGAPRRNQPAAYRPGADGVYPPPTEAQFAAFRGGERFRNPADGKILIAPPKPARR